MLLPSYIRDGLEHAGARAVLKMTALVLSTLTVRPQRSAYSCRTSSWACSTYSDTPDAYGLQRPIQIPRRAEAIAQS